MNQKPEYVFGLFEGGGAKGGAYAGVIEACEQHSIRFEGACGVSAGSIAAALVCAGLPPNEVSSLLDTPFSSIISVSSRNWLSRGAKAMARWAQLKGYKSSEGIETWLEAILRQALNSNQPVKFKDLPRPLAILAYDAKNGLPHIWSTRATPDESVSRAVRASCSLPFYFAPVETGSNSWYDGGIIENVPAFLIEELTQHTDLPTLAFRLKSTDTKIIEKPGFRGPLSRLFSKVGRVIEARSSATRPNYVDIRDIEIDIGNVATTDFSLAKTEQVRLKKAGQDAIAEYIKHASMPFSIGRPSEKIDPLLASKLRHATLSRTGELIDAAQHSVDIFAGDISWLEELAPYLIRASRRQISMRLLSHNANVEAIEYAQRLGVSVGLISSQQLLRATLSDTRHDSCKAIFVESKLGELPSLVSKMDFPRLIDHCTIVFDQLWATANIHERLIPNLRAMDITEIENALRTVPAYREAVMTLESLSPASVLPACRYVETFKLDRIRQVYALYDELHFKKGYSVLGTPWYSILPIVERMPERTGGELVVIDGTHRFYDAYVSKRAVMAIVLNRCETPLPSKPESGWDRVRITTAKLQRQDRYTNFQPEHFRQIKVALSKCFAARDVQVLNEPGDL